MDIFKLVGSVFIDTDEANKSLSKTDDKAGGLANTLSGFAKTAGKVGAAIGTAAVAVGSGVAKLTTEAANSYGEYEQLVGGIETMFGDSSEKMIQYANEAYKTAGLSASEYMDNVMGFSASLLQSVGGDTERAAEAANQALIDMSDNANKMGTDMSSIQNAYAGFAKQNYTMLDNLKLGYGGTKSEMERLLADAQAFSGVEYNIENLDDVYSAIHVIQTEMGITGTTALEAGTTLEGSMGSIKASMENLKTEVGSAVAPVFQTFLTALMEKMPEIQAMIESMMPIVISAVEKIIPVLMTIIDNILPTLQSLMEILLPIFEFLCVQVLPAVVEAIKNVVGFVRDVVIPIIQTVISKVKNAIDSIINGFRKAKDTIKSIFESIVEVIKKPINSIIGMINKMIDALNALSFDVPDWVPVLGGKTFGFNLKPIPELAEGGTVVNSGRAIVGEAGAELIDLPQGARVTPLTDNGSSVFDYEKMADAVTSALLKVLPELKYAIVPDSNGIFKVVQAESKRQYKMMGGYV